MPIPSHCEPPVSLCPRSRLAVGSLDGFIRRESTREPPRVANSQLVQADLSTQDAGRKGQPGFEAILWQATLARLERRVGIWQKERILLGRAPLGFRPGQQTLQCLNQGR